MVEVGRDMFVRKNWKKSEDDDKTFDMDTTPHRITTLELVKWLRQKSFEGMRVKGP